MPKLEEVVTGERKKSIASWARANKINPEFAKLMVESIDSPIEFMFNMKRMEALFKKPPQKAKDEIRDALLRVQIWCSINSHRDPVMAEKQLFIAQVIEKLFFNANILSEEEMEESKE
ncbi:MAG: hypothetical protein GXO64_03380 [Candidatus Micrarchaeota archaeon]|nr:hypothetical protein [Candidatus Micrarchaeota archaeon]